TQDTMLYHKSKVLFGLDLAKKHIAEGHQAVIVEGYTDVMAMHAAGVKTAVAACGTAFGPDHMAIIRRLMLDDDYFRGELIYTFDGDEAGQKAAMRAFEGDQAFTGQSFVSVAPEGMDPCDLRQEKGDAAVRDLVASRVPMFEFVIESLLKNYSLDTAEGRLQALRRTVPVVAGISDRVLQAEYARRLAGWVGWPNPDEVLQQVRAEAKRPAQKKRVMRRAQQPEAVAAPSFEVPNPNDQILWPQRESLKIALQYPEIAGMYFEGIHPDAFTHPAYRQVRDAIAAAGGVTNANPSWLPAVTDAMTSNAGRNFVSELAVEDVHADNLAAYADSVLSRLQEMRVGDQIAQLKAQLQRMRPSEDEESYNALFSDLVALEQARRELNRRAFGNS
ncbi:DNA primase, partial [Corynebacterium sp.]|uniref:DNA primase n=1 Tax=Corynebacterium sp. TaxID=1720 RepID=UPI002A913DDD